MGDHEVKTKTLVFNSDSTFDVLRRLVEYIFPALSAAYFGLSQIWGEAVFPNPDKISGTFAVIGVFVAVIVGMSRKAYKDDPAAGDGSFVVNTSNIDAAPYRFEFNHDLESLEKKDQVVLKVRTSGPVSTPPEAPDSDEVSRE